MVHQFKLLLILLVGIFANARSEKCLPPGSSSLCSCEKGVFQEGAGTKVICRDIKDANTLYQAVQAYRGFHIDYLKFIGLDIPYLPAGLFQGAHVTKLYVENSNLRNLYSIENATPSPFDGLEESLREIHITGTKEPSFWYWPDLKKFKNLKKFYITDSPLTFVGHNFAEIGGGSLESVAVRHSRVNRIHPQAFPELTNLRHADFEGNRLPYLVRTMFPNPSPHLEILNFRKNRLFTLNEDMFENMPSLIFLDLSENEFKKFENVVFSSLWNQLQFLFISDNPFECDCSLFPLKTRLESQSLPLSHDVNKITCYSHKHFRKSKLTDLSTDSLRCY